MLVNSFYNPKQLGDVLMVVMQPDSENQASEQKENVVRIFDAKTNQTTGYNFFNEADELGLEDNGHIKLSENQINIINNLLENVGFSDKLEFDDSPKFVVAHVDEIEDHPDSDHLHITKTNIGQSEDVQIVCGAPNVDKGQDVVAAIPGAVMPTGQIIWPGKLRGVDSYGMLCSARELGIPDAPQKKGILVLENAGAPGTEFQIEK